MSALSPVQLAQHSIHSLIRHLNNPTPMKQYRDSLMAIESPKPTVLKPLRDNVLLLPAVAPGKTAGGLFIPDKAKEAPLRGKVISAGPDAKSVLPGDTVLFEKYAGTTMVINDVEHLLLGEGNIVGVVTEE